MLELSANSAREELVNHILPYWMDRMIDRPSGGFYGRIDGWNRLHAHADKGIILNARILWTFSASFNALGDNAYSAMANRAYDYIKKHFYDIQHGGVYWMTDYQGNPVDRKKQIYAQAFTLYALAEYFKCCKIPSVLEEAIALFELIERHAHDRTSGGYLEAFDADWTSIGDVRLSEKDMNAEKTMNTHLHILEAYTTMCDVWPSERLRESLARLVRVMEERFVGKQGHFHLFFTREWELLSKEVSYGHDIEGSWLFWEALKKVENSKHLYNHKPLIEKLLQSSLEGMDKDGGLMNEGLIDVVTDTDKHWWPQAEALVGLVNMWEISGQGEYMEKARRTWQFILDHMVDRAEGEWHWRVDRGGVVDRSEDKAGPWKCPYHNGRAMLELIRRLD